MGSGTRTAVRLALGGLLFGATLLAGCGLEPSSPATPAPQATPTAVAPTALPTSTPVPARPTASAPPTVAPERQPTVAAAPPSDATTLPFRSASEAIAAYTQRLASLKGSFEQSDLERVLKTPLAESRVGFVNGHQFLESETGELSNFSYAINPLYNETTNGKERFLVFGNGPNFLNYRSGNLSDVVLANSDRAVWAVNNGYRATTIIQIDNDLGDDVLRSIVASRASLGFRAFVVGNEFNDPGAPWRYNLPRLLHASQVVKDTLKQLNVKNGAIYVPSVAYFETNKSLDDFLTYADKYSSKFPADGISLNLYGAVDEIRSHVASAYSILAKHDLEDLRFRIGELGSPTDTYHQEFGDEQLAYNYFPQAIALALSSEDVDTLDVFSVYEFGRDKFSLASLDGATLRPKSSLLAARLAARVFARVKDIDYKKDGDLNKVVVRRSDGVELWMLWSSADAGDLTVKKPDGADVYGALGNQLQDDRIVLTPRPSPYLAGTVKYVVTSD